MKNQLFYILALAGWLIAGAEPPAQRPIARISDVRNLSVDEAAKGLPVRVRGQVLRVHPTGVGFFMQADGVGIFVNQLLTPKRDRIRCSAGDLVAVQGRSNPGNFTPAIDAETIELTGSKPLPEARPFLSSEIYSATIDCDWVWMTGRIVSVHIFQGSGSGDNLMLEVAHDSGVLDVQVPLTEGSEQKINEFMFSRVRFNAVVGSQFNTNRQLIGRVFFVNSVDDLKVVDDEEPPGGVPVKAIHELMRSGENHQQRIRTQGMVTCVADRYIILRGAKACVRVNMRGAFSVVPGDYMEVEGFVLPHQISPAFAAREWRVIEHRAAPDPVALILNPALRDRWTHKPDTGLNQELVCLDATLVDISESFDLPSGNRERTLLCRHNKYLFEAKLPEGVDLIADVKPGAMLRLKGICNLTRREEFRWRFHVDWFWLQLRDAADIEILNPAPWWTPGRLLSLLGLALGVAAVFILWVAALRRTVRKQTGLIAEKVERESVQSERQRIARELHDHLEQGLAGMAIQLRACLKGLDLSVSNRLARLESAGESPGLFSGWLERERDCVEVEHGNLRRLIEGILRVLTHCSEESRSSILDLRGGLLERMDLEAALRTVLGPLVQECGAELSFTVSGPVRRLKQAAERTVLLVAKEAVSNAVRHGHPQTVRVDLAYKANQLVLRVEDDGCGFDMEGIGRKGRFGMQGMRERMTKLKGSFNISSQVGQGTVVIAEISSLNEWERL